MVKENIIEKIKNFSLQKQAKYEFKSSKSNKKQLMMKIKKISDLKLEIITMSQAEEMIHMLNDIENTLNSLAQLSINENNLDSFSYSDIVDEYSIKFTNYLNRLQNITVLGKENKKLLNQAFTNIITKLYFLKIELNDKQLLEPDKQYSKK